MAQIYALEGVVPVVDPTAFIHPTACLIGDVLIGPNVYIGPFASLRGDFGRAIVGAGANVQDHCMMHVFPGLDCVIEEDGHIGHGAILHGCVIGKNALIGMNSVIMDGAKVEESAIVAANAFVKAKSVIPARQLAAGSPAKILRDLTEEEIQWKREGTEDYKRLTAACHRSLVPVHPLTQANEERLSQRMNIALSKPKT